MINLSNEINELKKYGNILKNSSFWKSYFSYFSFAIFLVLVFVFLGDKLNLFNFRYPVEHYWTFFTHSFLHSSWSHILGNLKGYLFLIAFNLIIFYKLKKQKELRKVFWLIVLITPFISSITNYYLLGNTLKPMAGSSDIISAFIGFTLFSILFLLNKKDQFNKSSLLLLYFIPLGLIIHYGFSGIIAALILFIPVYIWILFHMIRYKDIKYTKIIVPTIVLIFVVTFTNGMFPVENVIDGSLIGKVSHFIGLCYGLLLGYFFK